MGVTCNNPARDDHYACVLVAITPPAPALHMKGDRVDAAASLQEARARRPQGEMGKEGQHTGLATRTLAER